jgi:hypothetical protein
VEEGCFPAEPHSSCGGVNHARVERRQCFVKKNAGSWPTNTRGGLASLEIRPVFFGPADNKLLSSFARYENFS